MPAALIDSNLASLQSDSSGAVQACGTDSVSSSAQQTESSTSSWDETACGPKLRSHKKRKFEDECKAEPEVLLPYDREARRRFKNRMAARENRARKKREREELEHNYAALQKMCDRLVAENARLRTQCSCGALRDTL